MNFSLWDTIFNFTGLLIWLKIWEHYDKTLFVNRHVISINKLSDAIIEFLRPVFFGLNTRVIAIISLLFLLILRGFISAGTPWIITMGISRIAESGLSTAVIFSFLSFGILLFRLWGLFFLYNTAFRMNSSDQKAHLLYFISRPFSGLKPFLQPAILIILGIILVGTLDWNGQTIPVTASDQAKIWIPEGISWNTNTMIIISQLILITFIGFIQNLAIIASLLIMLIIASWFSLLLGSGLLARSCNEWINFIMMPIGTRRLVLGVIDFTPIVFFFAIQLVYAVLMGIVRQLLLMLS